MEVNGPGPVSGASPIKPADSVPEVQQTPPAQPVSPHDEVEISSAGRALDKLSRTSDVRAERVAQIKAAIEAGTYDTPDKLEAAVEKLLIEVRAERGQR